MDIKGITRYLLFVFGLGYTLQIGAFATGLLDLSVMNFFHWLLILLLMFIPAFSAVAALLTTPTHEREAIEAMPQVWPIPMGLAFFAAVIPPLVFTLIYALGYLFFNQDVDFAMHEALAKLKAMSPEPLPPNSDSLVAYLMLTVGFPTSVILGATMFALIGFGFEYGWRAYLYNRLIPIGNIKATLVTAFISYIWVFPILFVAYGANFESSHMWLSLVKMLLFFMFVSMALASLLSMSKNLGLCAIFLGAIISQQTSGIFTYLFPMEQEPYTGTFGLIGLTTWALVALIASVWESSRSQQP